MRMRSLGESLLSSPDLADVKLEASTASGTVSVFFSSSLSGLCYAMPAPSWPRDKLYCNFLLQPADTNEKFNFSDITPLDKQNRVSPCVSIAEIINHNAVHHCVVSYMRTSYSQNSLSSRFPRRLTLMRREAAGKRGSEIGGASRPSPPPRHFCA